MTTTLNETPATLDEATTRVQPYLFFGGRCEEALEFYRKAAGAKLEAILRFSDSPEPPPPGTLAPGFEDKVMHASFRIGASTLMASDGCSEGASSDAFSLALSLASEAEADRLFTALAEGGKVEMPLARTFWSPCFGMPVDRFGVRWMINVVDATQAAA